VRAISLWQPWAAGVALRLKRFETRHWKTPYRGPLAIHAAKRPAEDGDALILLRGWCAEQGVELQSVMHFGAVVAVADLAAIVEITGDVGPIIERGSSYEYAMGNYTPGRFAWELRDVERLATPIPFRGHQALFDVPDALFGKAPPRDLLTGVA
jgi:activating signal cointegrator 1